MLPSLSVDRSGMDTGADAKDEPKTLFKKPAPCRPPPRRPTVEQQRELDRKKKIEENERLDEELAELRNQMQNMEIKQQEKLATEEQLHEQVSVGKKPSDSAHAVAVSDSAHDFADEADEDKARAERNSVPYNFKQELVVPPPLHLQGLEKEQFDDAHWHGQFRVSFPKDAPPEAGAAYSTYVGKRLTERYWFRPRGIAYGLHDLRAKHPNLTVFAISTRWIAAVHKEHLLIAEVKDPRVEPVFKPTKVKLPQNQVYGNIFEDTLALSDITGRAMLCTLPDCDEAKNRVLAPAQKKWETKRLALVSCFAMSHSHVVVLVAGLSLHVFERKEDGKMATLVDVRESKDDAKLIEGVSCATEGNVVIVGTASGKMVVFNLKDHTRTELQGSFDVDASFVATRKEEGIKAAAQLTSQEKSIDPRNIMLVCMNGRRIAAANKFEVRLWDMTSGKLRTENFHANNVVGMTIHDNFLVLHQMAGVTRIIDLMVASKNHVDYHLILRAPRIPYTGLHFDNLAMCPSYILILGEQSKLTFAKIKDEQDEENERATKAKGEIVEMNAIIAQQKRPDGADQDTFDALMKTRGEEEKAFAAPALQLSTPMSTTTTASDDDAVLQPQPQDQPLSLPDDDDARMSVAE